MRNFTIEVARKTTLGNYCLALLRKGYIEWHETKFGRNYQLKKDRYNVHQAREPDIIPDLIEGSADVGITRQSYLAQMTGVWPEIGMEVGNLSVVGKMDFCPDVLVPVASIAARKADKRILVSPQMNKVPQILYREALESLRGGQKESVVYPIYSIPSGLQLGTGIIGIARVSPLSEDEFKGDIGEDGYPYPRLQKYGFQAVSSAEIGGENISLSEQFDYPILIRNIEGNGDVDDLVKDILLLSERLGNSVQTVEYIKEDGKYRSTPVRSRSINNDVLGAITTDLKTNRFIYDGYAGKNFTPNSIPLLMYGTEAGDLKIDSIPLPKNTVAQKFAASSTAFKKQRILAAANGTEYVLIYGEDERESGQITIKNMKTRAQEKIKRGDVLNHVMTPDEAGDVLLIQEPGVPGYERRLNKPGEVYAKANSGLAAVHSNYRDMFGLLNDGRAKEAVLGYDRFIESLLNYYPLQRIPEISEFNEFAVKNDIPFEVERIGGSECKICLAGPIPELIGSIAKLNGVDPASIMGTIVTEFPNITNFVISSLDNKPRVRVVTGATEVRPNPVIDVVYSGDTLARNGKQVEQYIFASDAIVARRI